MLILYGGEARSYVGHTPDLWKQIEPNSMHPSVPVSSKKVRLRSFILLQKKQGWKWKSMRLASGLD